MFKKIWFQLHWFVGITAGSVLVVIGLTGAVLAFREEVVDAINPGVRHVALRDAPVLAPAQLLAGVQQAQPGRVVTTLTVSSVPGTAARALFAPREGQRRGEAIYLDPYTGAQQPVLRGDGFFDWVEELHRWLLLPRPQGRIAAGTLALCLMGLALSGLYLRWPRRPLNWRAWLTFDPALKGRSFLWGLHSVLGTWALLMYLVFTSTGIYWAFDVVRDQVDALAGSPRPPRAPAAPRSGPPAEPFTADELARGWAVFQPAAGPWEEAVLRLPARSGQALSVTWLALDAPHERARNRMSVQPATGEVKQDERYADKTMGGRFLAAIYPLHMGTYFGLPGRIVMALAALGLPAFAITGWMLYLDRRRKKRALKLERARMPAAAPMAGEGVLVAYASQSGTAKRIALQSAAALQAAGVAATVQPLGRLDLEQLRHHRRALIVASTFGDGDPPDSARRFAQQLAHGSGAALAHLQYGLLALGDRHYARFCGFGHTLDHGLQKLDAQPLFPMVEVDDSDAVALARWSAALGALAGSAVALPVEAPAAYQRWRLTERKLLNPGSSGGPLFELTLTPATPEAMQDWRAGALLDLLPRHAPEQVALSLQALGMDGEGTLAEQLSRSALPAPGSSFASAQALADSLQPLSPRRYSVASLPQDGSLQLLVRQERHENGLGLASGWLTAHAPLGAELELCLIDNPAFAPAVGDVPCIFIGNGSGLAGLRSHLRARVAAGRRRNWLLFGERQRAHDLLCDAEITQWLAQGQLELLDRVFSRDQASRIYVQDRLREQADVLRDWLAQGAVLFVCGSLDGMAAGVDAALTDILGAATLEDLIAEGRYRRDIY
ncbi:sulfite reductase flavoprotein subunit alpha [Xylophilus sp. GW821-FHT01B05]